MGWPGPVTGTPPGPSGGPFRVYPGRMCVGQRGLRWPGPRTGERAVRAFVVQEYLRLAVIRFQERTSFFVNRWLVGSIALSLALQLAIVYSPAQAWFGVTALGLVPWAILLGGLVIGFGAAIAVTSAVVSRYGRP